jgi:hypothetical protein
LLTHCQFNSLYELLTVSAYGELLTSSVSLARLTVGTKFAAISPPISERRTSETTTPQRWWGRKNKSEEEDASRSTFEEDGTPNDSCPCSSRSVAVID